MEEKPTLKSWLRSHSSAILATALVVSNSGLLSEKASVCLKAIAVALMQ